MGDAPFLKGVDRSIYTAFYGAIPPMPLHKQLGKSSALDIAPTLLGLAGAKWQGDQFGLGVNLFSARPTLLEQYGEEKFKKILQEDSAFYESFY